MTVQILIGDALEVVSSLRPASVQCVVTSPPFFGLRDYGAAGQIGAEDSLAQYVARLVAVFSACRRALRPDGTLWIEIGDRHVPDRRGPSDGGLKHKDLLGAPWALAFALRADGWWLRQECVWHKPDATPEPIMDRPGRDHSTVFLLSKSERYWYDTVAVRVASVTSANRNPAKRRRGAHVVAGKQATDFPWRDSGDGRNLRTVWTLPKGKSCDPLAAAFPTALAERCVRASSSPGDTVLDPFGGTGTVGVVAHRLERDAVLIEINEDRARIAEARVRAELAA